MTDPIFLRIRHNVDTSSGNLNITEVEGSKVAASTAKLKTMPETGGGATLETRVVRFSAWNAAMKIDKDCWSVWAAVTTISFESEFEAPKVTVETQGRVVQSLIKLMHG